MRARHNSAANACATLRGLLSTAGRRTDRRERAGGRRDPAGLRVWVLLPGNAEVSLTPGEAGHPINCHIAKGAQEPAFSALCR
ncbi:unnamed protein product [Sphagnum jensenii]|uniref:Uncharacterized protein n=1 Tax=Sphagnum jensenii TaxID=128206 RepID=A0ABP0VU66_9BRYO